MPRSFLSIDDLTKEELREILALASGVEPKLRDRSALSGRSVGVYFSKPSTRTRTAFTVAAQRLGAGVVTYGPQDLQNVTGETWAHTGRVLGLHLDMIVMRTNDRLADMRQVGDYLPTVNAMSSEEHPSQAVTDLITIKEFFGRLDDLHLLYVGEGNNTAVALAKAFACHGNMRMTLLCPLSYGIPLEVLKAVREVALGTGAEITQVHDVSAVQTVVDVVYTTRWETMGVPHLNQNWKAHFTPYRVDNSFLDVVPKRSGYSPYIMHDLPAVVGDEIAEEQLYGVQSLVWRQAYHKLTGAGAILTWLSQALACRV